MNGTFFLLLFVIIFGSKTKENTSKYILRRLFTQVTWKEIPLVKTTQNLCKIMNFFKI